MMSKSSSQRFWYRLLSLAGALVLLTAEVSGVLAVAQTQSQPEQHLAGEAAACLGAAPVTLSAGASLRSLQRALPAQMDWVQFNVEQGQRYRLNVDTSAGALHFVLYDGCSEESHSYPVNNGTVDFTAQRTATYYARVEVDAEVRSAATDYHFAVSDLPAAQPSKIKLAEAPAELHRRALDLLEEMRGNPDMPDWQEARLGAEVRLIYRPDLTEAAYYEFLAEKPGANGFEPAGFIQLSSNTHDYPTPHWNFTGLSPTQEMEEVATIGGSAPTQFYKLDATAYAAEYEQPVPLGISVVATDVVSLGTLPPKFNGLDSLPLDYESDTTENAWVPTATGDDNQTSTLSATLQITGTDQPVSLSEEEWGSWAALKSEYKEAYGVLLDGLKQDASGSWNYLAGIKRDGEALVKGESRTIRAMSTLSVTTITVGGEGAGAQFLQQEELSAGALPAGVRITVIGEPAEAYKELPVDITIRYTSGVTEAKRYLIINPSSLRGPNQVFMPVINRPGTPQEVVAADASTATVVNWGPWTEWWAAGGHAGQPLYNQIPPNTRVNNRACHSGCVPTAWAMLFGWADRRAAIPGSGWNHRFGIYRQNGGYGADAVAPIYEFQDRGIENVMMELGRHMGTRCDGDQGGTSIDDEWKAQRYLDGRTGATVRTLVANGWWIFGTSIDDTRNRTIAGIKGGQPVVISTWGHAPMAYGYRERSQRIRHCFIFCWYTTEYQRQFYINQGWGGAENGWIEAKTRFAGEILRN